jgi:NADH dehydrogenase
VTWNGLYARIARVLGKRRRYVHVPYALARTGARAVEWIPAAPLTVDQVKILEAGDNVVTTDDARETFGLPLVSLDEQIRRAA